MTSFSKLVANLSLHIFFSILAFANTKDLYACSNWWGWGLNSLSLIPTPFLGVCAGTDVASIDATVGAFTPGMASWAKADVGFNFGLFNFDKYQLSLSLRYAREGVHGSGVGITWDEASSLLRLKNQDSKISYAVGYVFLVTNYDEIKPAYNVFTYTIGFNFW
jgi:hypothetical protein